MKTWKKEALAVAILLSVTAFIAGQGWLSWLSAVAVFFTFCHIQVSTRLQEATERDELRTQVQRLSSRYEHTSNPPPIEEVEAAEDKYHHYVYCHRWLTRYLVLKEICWMLLFIALGSWPALVGVFIFLLYPAWRKCRKEEK